MRQCFRRVNAAGQRSRPQRLSLFQSPYLRHLPLRKHALSPGWAWRFPSICRLFARNLDGAAAEWSGFCSLNWGRSPKLEGGAIFLPRFNALIWDGFAMLRRSMGWRNRSPGEWNRGLVANTYLAVRPCTFLGCICCTFLSAVQWVS